MFKVSLPDGQRFFVKLPYTSDPGFNGGFRHEQLEAAAMAREANVLETLAAGDGSALWTPELIHFDPGTGTLVTAFVEACPMEASPASERRLSAMTQLGRALADLHRRPPGAGMGAMASGLGVEQVVAHLDSLSHITTRDLAEGVGMDWREFAATAQRLEEQLSALRRSWEPRALVHGDLRDDNVLLTPEAACLVDWELAGLGDPYLDLGTVVAHNLVAFLGWSAVVAGGVDGERSRQVRAAWAASCTQSVALLDAYRSAAGEDLLFSAERVVSWAGVVLLLLAAARLEQAGSLGALGRLYAGFAERLLTDPSARVAEMCRSAERHLDGRG